MIKQVTKFLYSISAVMVGEKLYPIANDEVAQQIKNDIENVFSAEVQEAFVGVNIDEIFDAVKKKEAIIFNCKILVVFKGGVEDKQQILKTITDYLKLTYVKEL